VNVLGKYNVADGRMSLASALLKRAFIAKETGLSFSNITLSTRGDMFGKPIFVPPESPEDKQWPYIDFNVSHQAGLTILVGIAVRHEDAMHDKDANILVGCDIVAPEERLELDLAGIKDEGFEEYMCVLSLAPTPSTIVQTLDTDVSFLDLHLKKCSLPLN
jgi:4'-phosphopantetheinyl transferase